ncbi:MAG TPA: peptidase M23 [Nitrospinae bacterium]|nr:peptidase M23 [Nitrospinota bacterium]
MARRPKIRFGGRPGGGAVGGILLLALVGGCSLAPTPEYPPRVERRGVYHAVRRGESLWRISRAYGVGVEQIAVLNGIANPDRLMAGVEIFIPGADRVRAVSRRSRAVSPRKRPRWAAPAGGRPDAGDGGWGGKVDFQWPVRGKVIRRFGTRNGVKYEGIAITAPRQSTVRAAAGGRVIFSDWGPGGLGRTVIIRHGGGEYHSIYAHNAINLVSPGQVVKAGFPIARLGNSGKVRGARLHFEIRYRTRPRNPLTYLP